MITCHKCGSRKITYYRQLRADGVPVVTARCENDHSPVKGKPFFSTRLFDVRKLPLLPSQAQMELPQPKRLQLPEVKIPFYPKPTRPIRREPDKNIPLPVEES